MDILKTSELEQARGATMICYAASGVGKTTLSGTLPEGKTLILDMDRGATVLRGKSHDVVEIRPDLSNLQEVVDYIRKEKKYSYIVLDTVSELEKNALMKYAKEAKNGTPDQNNYHQCQYQMRALLRDLRNLRDDGITVVFVFHETNYELEVSDGTVVTKTAPALTLKKLIPEVLGLVDVVAHLEISHKPESKGARFLRLEPTPTIEAKNRLNEHKFFEADLSKFLNIKEEAIEEKEKTADGVRAPERPSGVDGQGKETVGIPDKK